MTLLPHGRRRVRLENGHQVTALPPRDIVPPAHGLGDAVVVQIAPDQLQGWRLARRP